MKINRDSLSQMIVVNKRHAILPINLGKKDAHCQKFAKVVLEYN